MSVVVGLLLSLSALTTFATQSYFLDEQPVPKYPKNEVGQTYGSAAMAVTPEQEPNLIKAVGVGGVEGFIYREDLAGKMPSTPEEALAKQKQTEKLMARVAAGKPVVMRTIPLYEVDGVTVIGKFEIINKANPNREEDK